MRKKGALNLSIQAIVIIVLAMTLLGLGLGFVRNIFDRLGGQTDDVFDTIGEQLDTDLKTSDEPLLFSKTQKTLNRGDTSLEGFGVRNDGDRTMAYGIQVLTFNCPDTVKDTAGKCTADTSVWFDYVKGDGTYNLRAADRKVNKVQINVPRSAITGRYLIQIIGYLGTWPATDNCADDYDPDTKPDGCAKFGQTELFLTVA